MADVAVIMGSQSDYNIMKEAESALQLFNISFVTKIVSAHRTPQRLFEFSQNAHKNGFKIIIAGAGGAAHLPGMVASISSIPVIGVPVESKSLKGIDSLLSIAQMPKGVPVATVAINGAYNAGLLAVSMLAISDANIHNEYIKFKQKQAQTTKEDVVTIIQ